MNWPAPFARTWVALRARCLDPLRARWALREEHRLLRKGPRPGTDDRSLLFFSLHRSGSTFLHRVLRDLAGSRGYRTVNLERYWTLRGRSLEEAFADRERLERVIHPRGYYYGPFRGWRKLPGLGGFSVLLTLRDPRDVLTSQYFSLTRSHRMLSVDHYEQRREARGMDIDTFVLSEAEGWRRKYGEYFEHLVPRENVLLVRYEDLVEDFPGTLGRVAEHLGLPTDGEVWDEVVARTDVSVEDEDARRHRRQVGWGDFRDKLQPPTVRRLNARFEEVLERLDYPT